MKREHVSLSRERIPIVKIILTFNLVGWIALRKEKTEEEVKNNGRD